MGREIQALQSETTAVWLCSCLPLYFFRTVVGTLSLTTGTEKIEH